MHQFGCNRVQRTIHRQWMEEQMVIGGGTREQVIVREEDKLKEIGISSEIWRTGRLKKVGMLVEVDGIEEFTCFGP